MFDTNPTESKEYKGFYETLVAGLLLKPDGSYRSGDLSLIKKVIDSKSDKHYPSIHVTGSGTVLIHRILAMTFIKCPGKFEDYQVNHIDGNKNNYSLDNLEWVTTSENSLHAYQSGLRKDNRPVLVKDLITNSESEFYSLQAASRFLGVNGGTLRVYLRNRSRKVPFRWKYEAIYKGEEWRGLTSEDVGVERPGRPKVLVTISHDRKKAIVYESAEHLSTELSISAATVHWWFKTGYVPKKYGFDIFYMLDLKKDSINKKLLEKAEFRKHIRKNIKKSRMVKRKPVPITVTNLDTGEVSNWNSTEEFGNLLGVKKNTIQKGVLVNNGYWRNYLIVYRNDTDDNLNTNKGQPSEKSVD